MPAGQQPSRIVSGNAAYGPVLDSHLYLLGVFGQVTDDSWGELVLKEAAIRDEVRYDDKWVLRTTNTELPAAEVYKGLWRVEHAFRELKSGLEIRPVFLRTEEHVRGHIVVCFLALVMEAALQRLLKEQGADSYREVPADLEEVRAVQLRANRKSWLVCTELSGTAFQAFKAVGLFMGLHTSA